MSVTKEYKRLELENAANLFGIGQCESIRQIPVGESGPYEIEDFIDTDNEYIYQRLLKNDKLITDNNPKNLKIHKHFINRAKGKILIFGLGLGTSLYEILKKDSVKSVLVVEKEKDIINLVAPAFSQFKHVKIVNGDAFKYRLKKSDSFDIVYHAIWNSEKEIKKKDKNDLFKKYQPYCTWQGHIFEKSTRGGYRPGSGRKPGVKSPKTVLKKPDIKRTVKKGIRYTPKEHELIQLAAKLSGKTESAIAVAGAVNEAQRIIVSRG